MEDKGRLIEITYADGSCMVVWAADWRKACGGDTDTLAIIDRVEAGESVMMGGGAEPLCCAHL